VVGAPLRRLSTLAVPIFLDPVTPEHRRRARARRQRRVLLALIVALTAVALAGAVDPAVAEIARAAAAIGASLVLVILAIVLLLASGGGQPLASKATVMARRPGRPTVRIVADAAVSTPHDHRRTRWVSSRKR